MPTPDPYREQDLHRLRLFVTLVPVVGFLPALWTLYRRQGSSEVQNVSRLSVTLTLGWLLGYGLLGAGAQLAGSTASTLSLLILSSLLTSGYFLVNLWLMVRLWQRKSLRLPAISRLSDRLD